MFCLLCEKKPKFKVISKTVRGDMSGIINVVQCSECGHVQLSPRYYLKEHYENDSQNKEIKKTFKKTNKQIYQTYLSLADGVIKRLEQDYKITIHKNTKIMDFGSGSQVLSLLINSQYNCYVDSLEISKTIVNNGLKYFKNIYEKTNDKLNIILNENFIKTCKNKYNIITMIHVLEHLNNLDVVGYLYKLLDSDGKLIIEVPNENDILKIKDNYKSIMYQIHHTSYFNEDTLGKLLDKLRIKNYHVYYYHRYNNIKNFLGIMLDSPIISCVGDPSTSDNDLQNFWLDSMIKKKCTDSMAVVISKE